MKLRKIVLDKFVYEEGYFLTREDLEQVWNAALENLLVISEYNDFKNWLAETEKENES